MCFLVFWHSLKMIFHFPMVWTSSDETIRKHILRSLCAALDNKGDKKLLFSSQKKGTKTWLPLGSILLFLGKRLLATHLGYEKKQAASGLRYHRPPLFGPVKLEALLFRARNALKKRRKRSVPHSLFSPPDGSWAKNRVLHCLDM